MHAGIDILRREWDPLGARLGDLSSEDVIHHVYNLLGIVLRGGEPERVERQISARLASIEEEVFGLRPSPRAQRRYLARRFIQVVVDAPGSAHEVDPWEETMRAADASMAIARAEGRLRETRTGVTVCFGPRGDEPSKLDPTAACTECGAIGTVAVVGREVEPLYSRYCPTCWREVRDKYWDRVFSRRPKNPEEETTPEAMIAALERMSERMLFDARERVRMVGSAMWEDRAPYIERWLAPAEGESPADHEQRLRRLARDVVAEAGTMYGAMPPAIEAFVQRYASADQPPASPSDQH
jgi:hypothetical protein